MHDKSDHTTTYSATTIEEAISLAIQAAIGEVREAPRAPTSMLVFSGEGATPEGALREALTDIRAVTADHGCRAIAAQPDGIMQTDTGTRIWGTLECIPRDGAASRDTSMPQVMIREEGEGRWTVTIRQG